MGVTILTVVALALILAVFKIDTNVDDRQDNVARDRYNLVQIFKFGSPFLYFTTLSNLALGLALTLFGLNYKKNGNKFFNFLFLSTSWMGITFWVYWFLISWVSIGMWKTEPLSGLLSVLLHGINPIAGFVALYLLRHYCKISYKAIWLATLLFCMYGILTVIFYFGADWLKGRPLVFYAFLDYKRPFFYSGGNIWVTLILNIILISSFIGIPLLSAKLIIRIMRIKISDGEKKRGLIKKWKSKWKKQ
ncbi:hypothetical protein NV226_02005 [Mycoplasma iguanae]|uniref:Uncharacterized protein n=1 Tax=Mycoplasma iguanae TaxID=292461 RepID=A0ABY5R9N0_9MOLU|nr:hypothetical protein [Mycoplasma iguanae]UVD81489.1 hypothetical protein NV226_02005 [Mycoplasma iguanae]